MRTLTCSSVLCRSAVLLLSGSGAGVFARLSSFWLLTGSVQSFSDCSLLLLCNNGGGVSIPGDRLRDLNNSMFNLHINQLYMNNQIYFCMIVVSEFPWLEKDQLNDLTDSVSFRLLQIPVINLLYSFMWLCYSQL